MIQRFMIRLLAVGLGVVLAASAQAQSGSASTTLQITLRSAPHWAEVPGTRVQVIRPEERPDYDMFHYGNDYYVYQNDRWYRSNQWRGSFTQVDDRSVPSEFARVPREHWRKYPSAWQERRDQGPGGVSATFQVDLRRAPRWIGVRGTRVREIRSGQRPDYDMFSYGNTYYVYSNDRWYMSRNWRGTFTLIDDRSVPREFSRVPRDHWRRYPQGWGDANRDRRSDHPGRAGR